MIRSKVIAFLLVAGSLATICPRAEAQSKTESDATARLLYEEGRSLLKAEKYAEACRALEDSNRLTPAINTKFWLADCYEHTGRIAKAWQLFRDVVEESKSQGDQEKADFARERVDALVPRLAKIKIAVPTEVIVEGLEVKWNGVIIEHVLTEQEIVVDPGEYVITAVAPGKKAWEQRHQVGEGTVVVVTIPTLEEHEASVQTSPRPGGSSTPVAKPVAEPDQPSWGLRGAAIGASAIGVAGLVAGTALGLQAKAQWIDAQDACGADENSCTDAARAKDLSTKADKSATSSTIGFAVGGAGLAAGVVLWLLSRPSPPTTPSSSLMIAPSVGPRHTFVTVSARF